MARCLQKDDNDDEEEDGDDDEEEEEEDDDEEQKDDDDDEKEEEEDNDDDNGQGDGVCIMMRPMVPRWEFLRDSRQKACKIKSTLNCHLEDVYSLEQIPQSLPSSSLSLLL